MQFSSLSIFYHDDAVSTRFSDQYSILDDTEREEQRTDIRILT